jgi:hypothetical protein
VRSAAFDVSLAVITHTYAGHAMKALRIKILRAPERTIFVDKLNRWRVERIIETIKLDVEALTICVCETNKKTKVIFG